MFALLGGTWTSYSQGRASGDDEASTESQESRSRSMELLVQPDELEDYATPPRSVSGERQSREVSKRNGRVEGCAVGYIRDQERGTKD